MKTTIFAGLIASICLFTPAIAAEAQVIASNEVPAGTELIKVTTATQLLNALTSVTGLHEEVVGQGASQKTAMVPYNFDTNTLWALTDDINVLQKLVTTVQGIIKAKTLQAETRNGGPLKPKKEAVLDANRNVIAAAEPSDEQKALNAELENLVASDRPVAKLLHIKRADLKLNENHIPGITLSALAPILEP